MVSHRTPDSRIMEALRRFETSGHYIFIQQRCFWFSKAFDVHVYTDSVLPIDQASAHSGRYYISIPLIYPVPTHYHTPRSIRHIFQNDLISSPGLVTEGHGRRFPYLAVNMETRDITSLNTRLGDLTPILYSRSHS